MPCLALPPWLRSVNERACASRLLVGESTDGGGLPRNEGSGSEGVASPSEVEGPLSSRYCVINVGFSFTCETTRDAGTVKEPAAEDKLDDVGLCSSKTVLGPVTTRDTLFGPTEPSLVVGRGLSSGNCAATGERTLAPETMRETAGLFVSDNCSGIKAVVIIKGPAGAVIVEGWCSTL